jgi:hypothetical protein
VISNIKMCCKVYSLFSKIHEAEGDGQVKIRWFKDRSINIAEHITNIDGTLTFLDVQRSDAGRYTCMAYTDKQGSINSTINIDVVGKLSAML